MKKIFVMAGLALLLTASAAQACDICGCGVSNYNPYLFPHLSRSYIGMAYYHRLYRTHTDEGAVNEERYNAFVLTGQYSLGKRLQLTAIVPIQVNHLRSETGRQTLSGLGDITLMTTVKVWEHMTKTQRHTLTAGAGLKLSTGRYTPAGLDKSEEQNFQLGTGSMDYLVNGAYRLALSKWVFAATTSYKYNTQNSDGFRYGDVWTSGATAIYRKDWNKLSLLPYVSLTNEHYMQDADNHQLQSQTGGNVWLGSAGVDVNTRKIAIGINYQTPFQQHLAQGLVDVQSRVSAHVSFTL